MVHIAFRLDLIRQRMNEFFLSLPPLMTLGDLFFCACKIPPLLLIGSARIPCGIKVSGTGQCPTEGALVALLWNMTRGHSKQYVRNPDGSLKLLQPKPENYVPWYLFYKLVYAV